MRHIIFMLGLLPFLFLAANAQPATTQTAFVGTCQFSGFTASGSNVVGTLANFSDQTNLYFANDIEVGDVAWDNLGTRWEIVAITSSNLVQAVVEMRNVNGTGGLPFGQGFVSRETPNLGLSMLPPDNATGISPQLKSRVEGHNALMVDNVFNDVIKESEISGVKSPGSVVQVNGTGTGLEWGSIISGTIPLGVRFLDNFARASLGANYVKVGTSASFTTDGSKLLVSGGVGNSFSDYIYRDDYVTDAEDLEVSMTMVVTTVNATSWGTGIGIRSFSNSVHNTQSFIANVSTTSDANNGRIYIYGSGVPNVVSDSRTPISTNDTVTLKITIIKNAYIVTALNHRTKKQNTFQVLYPLGLPASGIVPPNHKKFAITAIGGSCNVVDFRVSVLTPKEVDYLLIGDSQSAGFYGGSVDDRIVNILASFDRTKIGAVYAQQGVVTADILQDTSEIIALSPKNALLMVGYNDAGTSIQISNAMQNLKKTKEALERNGINVVFVSIPFNGVMNDSIINRFSNTNIYVDYNTSITTNGTSAIGPFIAADNVHLSRLGNIQAARAIYSALKNLFPMSLPYSVGDGKFSNQGDAFNYPPIIGTRDNYALRFMTNGVERGNISNSGRWYLGGTTTATATLHLPAGTATSNTAPLKLTAGTNLSTPEPGAIEFDGSFLHYTNSSGVRNTLAVRTGTGSPEGVVTANVGTMYLRSDGGAGTTLYIKESGTGNTGWVAK